jgi:predicted neuraminidase
MRSAFVFEQAPFASAHASTIAETADGLIVAWFGGPHEGHPEVGIWCARAQRGRWSEPCEVAHGVDWRGRRQPCWNPVLHQVAGSELLLFYKVGPSPRRWWGALLRSFDGGRSWSAPELLPAGILGPVKNKPHLLAGGGLLCPSSTEHRGWRCHFELTPDRGASWQRSPALQAPWRFGAIQPCILDHGSGRLQLLARSRNGVVATAWSAGDWRRWSALEATGLPNPDSGIDALTLAEGRALLVCNPVRRGRAPLALALSHDGLTWQPSLVLEQGPGEFSYPALIQGADRRLHITYTWQRQRIRYVTLTPGEL